MTRAYHIWVFLTLLLSSGGFIVDKNMHKTHLLLIMAGFFFFSPITFAQEIKTLSGHSYQIFGTPIGEVESTLFTWDASMGVLKSYALIKDDSLFITNEYYMHDTVCKVEVLRTHKDSIFRPIQYEPAQGGKIYSPTAQHIMLVGKPEGGTQIHIISYEYVERHFVAFGFFIKDENTAIQFIEKLD